MKMTKKVYRMQVWIRVLFRTLSWILPCLILCGCQTSRSELEPKISYTPQACFFETLPTGFENLTPQEKKQHWGKELFLAKAFARELDFYRAITAYKSALFLMPEKEVDRRLEAEYGVVYCYFLGKKYQEAAEFFETSQLRDISSTHPIFHDLLILLYTAYTQTEQDAKADKILAMVDNFDRDLSHRLQLENELSLGNIKEVEHLITSFDSTDLNLSIDHFLHTYQQEAKSTSKARLFNAILPGAGYLYVGQKKTAFTSLMLNGLFIAAASHFFEHGNIAAGLVTLSFEMGWYVGGITGAGLAAKEYNEQLYETRAKEVMLHQQLFPILMFKKSF